MQLYLPDSPDTYTTPLKIAIGKGRGFHESLSLIEMPPASSFNSFRKGDIPVYHDTAGNITLVTVRSRDMCWLLEQGHIDVAIGSSVWFHEYGLPNLSCLQPLPLQQCRLSLIAPRPIALSRIKTICTKFSGISQNYIAAHGMTANIIPMEGSHEAALFLHIADAIIDVIETGRTIERMGFCELDSIISLSHEIWCRKKDEATQKRLSMYLKQPVY
ncbi:ATP phosphoribosyltransferase [Chitinophaga sp.]|uniref:ATP phosphoribosyltransferase n=1 Tax=Chitinophaga sp. TaxID=1869181 RepID=UPI002F940543